MTITSDRVNDHRTTMTIASDRVNDHRTTMTSQQ
jgi:hypothetical protein